MHINSTEQMRFSTEGRKTKQGLQARSGCYGHVKILHNNMAVHRFFLYTLHSMH
jgi:hypothetical protein